MDLISMYGEVSLGDWQREYLYKVVITPPVLITSLLPPDVDVFIQDFKAPGSRVKVIKKDISGQWANFAGPLDAPGTTEATFMVDENNVIMKFLEAWHAMSGDDGSDSAYPKADYVGTIRATLYKTDKDTPVLTVTLLNAWLPEVGELSLDKTKDGLLTTKGVIAYDRRQVTFH